MINGQDAFLCKLDQVMIPSLTLLIRALDLLADLLFAGEFLVRGRQFLVLFSNGLFQLFLIFFDLGDIFKDQEKPFLLVLEKTRNEFCPEKEWLVILSDFKFPDTFLPR